MNDIDPERALNLQRRIDRARTQFEDAWLAGNVPRTEDFLGPFRMDERTLVLDALQNLRKELILRHGPIFDVGPKTTEYLVTTASDDSSTDQTLALPVPPTREFNPCGIAPRVTFRVISGPHEGLEFVFDEHNTLFAGRVQKAQLRLEKDPHFSRHHFRLEVNPPTCFLMDLNSRNGTFVNGERVKDRFLSDGDIISGGLTEMVVSIIDPRGKPSESIDTQGHVTTPGRNQVEMNSPPVSQASPPLAASGLLEQSAASLIPGYEILEQIGEGDLGVVYRAKRLVTKEICALKILSPAGHSDENSISTFLREAKILNQLQHPHIIRLIDLGAAGPNVFLATEYVKSYDWTYLAARYSAEKRIRIACGLMVQILGALEYAHARSLVHRDVKPGNILITKSDDKMVAKLADFGLAKQYTTAGMSQVTRDGDVLGSLPFMSPDQFLNSREARPTCDVYSAGATLYWMLTGREPIPLEGHPCKFLAILESPPTPIRHHNRAIPENLAQVVHRSLEKTAEKRFVSAAEMRQQLRIFLK